MCYNDDNESFYIAQRFPEERGLQGTYVVPDHQMSFEDSASGVLRSYYGTLSQYLHHPINVAQLLFEEKMISETTLSHIEDSGRSQSEIKGALLKAVRQAVHINHHNLEVFASVLKMFTENVPFGDAIFNDYG